MSGLYGQSAGSTNALCPADLNPCKPFELMHERRNECGQESRCADEVPESTHCERSTVAGESVASIDERKRRSLGWLVCATERSTIRTFLLREGRRAIEFGGWAMVAVVDLIASRRLNWSIRGPRLLGL
jgi:hypothetical protein